MLREARIVGCLAALLGWAGAAGAQNVGGSIQGTVKDAGGDVLPGVQVVVRNLGTGAVQERTTDGTGHFLVPLLPPGEYEVHFAMARFKPLARRGIRLAVGQGAVLDAALELGQRAEEVIVEADVSRVNLASGALSGLVGEHEIR